MAKPLAHSRLGVQSRLKQIIVYKKTAIERDKFYETLIKRLAFKTQQIAVEDEGGKKKRNVPRYMQQTGKAGKKFLVLLKVDDKSMRDKNER